MYNKSNIVIKNKRASFDYEILDRFVAGIQLYGTEIKSIRDGKAGLSDTYCTFINNELWVKNMHIATYFFGTYNNHDVRRDRKLLPVSYTHLRAHETGRNLVCRLLL